MKVQCKNCLPKEGIAIPEFTQSDKTILSDMKRNSSIKTVKYLIDNFKLSIQDSKYITTHINERYGKCNRCNFNELDKECANCPKCRALNLNWKTDIT